MTTASPAKTRRDQRLHGVDRRAAILTFIEDYCTRHGYGPSMREIAAGVGLATAGSVAYELGILLNAGCITRTPGIARSIRVVEA